ncbi:MULTISPECIES: hypothetical protein [unclassified Acidovorax]|uniref:hypothetical protein n=1 Tax=unclassified Acidovorax TaxID=2684926 RepID=UPI001C47C3E9|nr:MULTISPECIES: hypothetical protein [unclassified Acidovorax]MBV7430051.1 hypothetical protein [Acidovorax sp. sif0732]MBV7451444.1 hypothetical protein [Acidovorax sp. sif0715]
MPMEYLRELERDALPLIESDVVNIDKLRVLRAAGMVEVQLPPVDSPQQKAQVLYITGLGCATLRAYRSRVRAPRPQAHTDLEASYD